jgi:hypothetical protein
MSAVKVGMNICESIRGKANPGERCTYAKLNDSDWCGRHGKQKEKIRWTPISHPPIVPRTHDNVIVSLPDARLDVSSNAVKIFKAWRRWLSRRAGPALWCREESNNPFDFYSSDTILDIPLGRFISFVDSGKAYCMDSKSAASLLQHAEKNHEEALNPFNRAPLPALFIKRLQRHGKILSWEGLTAVSEVQQNTLQTTDIFRLLEDLGNYTDPSWFMDLNRIQLQQLYIELADIWFHRAGLSSSDRNRIIPPTNTVFRIPVTTVLIMTIRALRPLLMDIFRMFISSAESKSDRQLGATYILGALSLVSYPSAVAYPWLLEAFYPGATRILSGQLVILHQTVLMYGGGS